MSRTTTFAAAAAIAALAFVPAVASAQICQGIASFSAGPVQLGAGLDFSGDVTSYGAGIGFGAVNGGFVNGQIARAEDDESDASATVFGVSGGWQIGMGMAPSAVQLCPIAGYQHVDAEGDFSANEFALGLSLGTTISSTQALAVVPFGAVTYRHASFDLGILGDDDENYGQVDLGVGFVANEWITIRPSVSIPFAEPDGFDSDNSYGVRFIFSFGKPATR